MATVSEHIGQWQVMLVLLLGCNYFIVGINHTLPTFQSYTPHFFCQADNVSARAEGCVRVLNTQNETSCPHGYQFESDREDWTVVTEWQLVCERRYLRSLIATLYFCGVTIGAVVCGLQADRYGRRPVMLTCVYTQGLLGVSLYFTQAFEVFMAVRFIQGFFVQGLQATTYTLLVELFPPRSRTAVGVALELYWASGLMYLAGASYYVPNWRLLELVLSIPTALTLLYVCLVPESTLWLAVHGRVEVSEGWKRTLSCYRRQNSSDTNSIKSKTGTLKCTEYASGPLSQNTKNQQIANNDIIHNETNSIPINSFNFGHPDTGTQLMAHSGEECKGIMKENIMADKLKVYSGYWNASSVGTEHIARNASNLCNEDDGDFDNSQHSNYSRAPSTNTAEASHLLSCEILSDQKGKVNGIHRVDYRKEKNPSEGDKMADFTLVYTNRQSSSSSTMTSDDNEKFKLGRSQEQGKGVAQVCLLDRINSDNDVTVDTTCCSCHSMIMKGIDDTQKDSDRKSLDICNNGSRVDALKVILRQTVQDLKDDERKLVGLQSMSEVADNTGAHYDRNQGKTFTVDGKNVDTSQVSSIVMLRENYGMVNKSETEITAAVTEDRETINDVVPDGTVKLNTSGTDVSNDDEITCSNVAKKLEIVENRTVPGTQKIMATATKRTGFFELFRSPILRKYNLIMVLVWFSVSLLYYGIMFHLPDLSGERHLNFFLGAVVELISYVFAYIVLSRFGRRLPMASFLLISGVICIAVGAVSAVPGKDSYWIGATVTALALIGKGVAVSGFCTIYLYASELFPTVLRGVAMGHCGFWGRVGSLVAPQLLFLGEYTLPPVPLMIMGVLGILAGLSVLLLPETLGKKLPDTVEEIEICTRN